MMSVNAIKYKGEILAEDSAILAKSPGVLGEYKELRADALEADTLDLTVVSESDTIQGFALNDKVEYFRDGARVGVYYLQSVTRVGPRLYTLSALSAVGRLIARTHRGGIYTGQTVAEVVADICGELPVLVETVYRGIKLYGWLPIATARDNLARVLFAIGAWLHTDENGTLRVQKLWSGTASTIGAARVHAANIQVKYLDPVSAVSVTEHQYVPGTEEVTLFEGTAQEGDVIEFDEPAHTLAAEGFTIRESGANYAILSAGTGTLTGKRYVHNMRVVTRTVTQGAAENVVEVSDATLVSVVNAAAVAQRLADYYVCREQLIVDVNPAGEHAGHVVELWDEWDKQLTLACIASRETRISGLLKSRTTALVGYVPPQPETSEYYDERVVLTGSGTWTVPEGVTSVRATCIGGGQGGKCGQPGGLPTAEVHTETSTRTGSSTTYKVTAKGFYLKELSPTEGGAPGEGGHPGKFLAEDLTVVAGSGIAYACGVGGAGGAYEPTTSPEGSLGTASVFGSLSSDAGTYSDDGYVDSVSGELFASKGESGMKGGNGVGYDANGSLVTPEAVVVDGVSYTAGANNMETADLEFGSASSRGAFSATSRGGLGGGPAYKANGGPGGAPVTPVKSGSNGITVHGGAQGTGATAQPPEKAAVYGKGGTGGNGGGGNGQSQAYAEVVVVSGVSVTTYLNVYAGAATGRGNGSVGGQGGDGCIILYYRRPKIVQAGWRKDKNGKPMLDRLGRRIIV